MQLTWRANFSASCFHAARLLARGGEARPPELAAALAEPTEDLHRKLQGYGDGVAWGWLCSLSANFDSNRNLAEAVLIKTIGRGRVTHSAISALAGRLDEAEAAAWRAIPNLEAELSLRIRPLREHWEARGPGMLKALAFLTDDDLLADQAEVIIIHPASGGGGVAHPLLNSVHIEGVLANPAPDLPETLRLCWMLAQLQNDLPKFSENLPARRFPTVSALAMIPPTLEAGQRVELCRYDDATMANACRAWIESSIEEPRADAAAILFNWWETFRDQRPHWSVALAALHRMLFPDDE